MPLKNWIIFFITISLIPVYAQEGEGKPVKEIRYEGLDRTKEYIVTRELTCRVGEPFHQEHIADEHQRLEMLDIFSEIKIEPELDGDSVIVHYRFVETFPFLPTISIQINDENGISAGLGLKSPNLLGRDIYFSGRFLLGGANTLELWLENPWVTGNHLGYKVEYFHRERDNVLADFYESANEFYLRIGGYWGDNGRIGGSLELVNIKSDRDGRTLSSGNADQVRRLGAYLGYDSRDAYVNTNSGWWNEVALSWESNVFGSSSEFNQLDLDIRRYISIGERHTVALFSLTTLRNGEVDKDIAQWQLFGLGGTNTVRGWEFASRKGKNQFINTLEYRFTLLEPRLLVLPFNINYNGGMHVALFGDYGIVWDEDEQFTKKNFIGGFGLGLRFMVPIVNMLRLDVGWGESGKGAFLHLGSFEKPFAARRRVR